MKLITISTSFNMSDADNVEVIFTQAGDNMLVKSGDEIAIEGNSVQIVLSEREVDLFEPGRYISINVEAYYDQGTTVKSYVMYRTLNDITDTSRDTEMDSSSGSVKILISNSEKDYVTPEMFGARGDGIKDDTQAWQSCLNSGRNIVCAENKTYKVNNLTCDHDCKIDFNGANFIAAENWVIKFTSEHIGTITNEPSYEFSDPDYAITNEAYSNYSGYALMRSLEKMIGSEAPEYLKGCATMFENGQLMEAFQFDIPDPTIDFYNALTIELKNLKNVSHITADTLSRGFIFENCVNCCVEGFVTECSNYAFLEFGKCINTKVEHCVIRNGFTSNTNNSYPIVFDSCNHSFVEKCIIYNKYWHCISTGGYNPSYYCNDTVVKDCNLKSLTIYAFVDHANGFSTKIMDTELSGAVLFVPCKVQNVVICDLGDGGSNQCMLTIRGCASERQANVYIENVLFKTYNSRSSVYHGISFQSATKNVYSYIKYAHIKNIKANYPMGNAAGIKFIATNGYLLKLGDFLIDNVRDMSICGVGGSADISEFKLTILNSALTRLGYSNYLTFNDLILENVNTGVLSSITCNSLIFNNLTATTIGTNVIATNLKGGSLFSSSFPTDLILNATSVAIALISTGTYNPSFNIGRASNGKYYRQTLLPTGYETSEIVAS